MADESDLIKLLNTNNQLPNGETIIDDSSSGTNYFARGHLSPDAAFIEGAEQDATYFFINVAPQFLLYSLILDSHSIKPHSCPILLFHEGE